MARQIQEPFREVAAAILVGTCGRVLLQQRDDIPGLLYAGMIGLFGGHREGEETFLACLQRELHEETGLTIEARRCEPLVRIDLNYPSGGGVKGHFFVVRDVPIDGLVITEGSPLVIEVRELAQFLARMTPSTCTVARLFMELNPELER